MGIFSSLFRFCVLPGLVIRVADTQEDVDAISVLLAEHVEHPSPVLIPRVLVEDEVRVYPVLVGAWAHGRLVGGAFVGPDVQEAQWVQRHGLHGDAKTVYERVVMIHGLAVEAGWRRRGIGLALKRWIDVWAGDHGADVVLSVPTTQAARCLNEKAGHHVLPAGVALVLEVNATPPAYVFPAREDTTWAFGLLTETNQASVRVGQYLQGAEPGGANTKVFRLSKH